MTANALPPNGELERNAANVAAVTAFNLQFMAARRKSLRDPHVFGPVELHSSVLPQMLGAIDQMKDHIGLEMEFDEATKIGKCYFIPRTVHGQAIIRHLKAGAAKTSRRARK